MNPVWAFFSLERNQFGSTRPEMNSKLKTTTEDSLAAAKKTASLENASNAGGDSDEQIMWACAHYNRTGEIADILLAGFDQLGKWVGLRPNSNGWKFDESLTRLISKETIPQERLVHINGKNEAILLSSFVTYSNDTLLLDYQHINGSLFAQSTKKILAPQLQSVAGYLLVESAIEFEVPELQFVGRNMQVGSVIKLITPHLKKVGGWLGARSATEFHAPQLRNVGSDLLLPSITEFDAPCLKSVDGILDANSAKTFHAPALQSVYLSLNAAAATEIHVPSLQTVGGLLGTDSVLEFRAPQICHVIGDLRVLSALEIRALNLVSVSGSLLADSAKVIIAPKLQCGGERLGPAKGHFHPKHFF